MNCIYDYTKICSQPNALNCASCTTYHGYWSTGTTTPPKVKCRYDNTVICKNNGYCTNCKNLSQITMPSQWNSTAVSSIYKIYKCGKCKSEFSEPAKEILLNKIKLYSCPFCGRKMKGLNINQGE